MNYLNDLTFLQKLDELNIRVVFAKITLMSFDERPEKEIQGNIISGSLNLNGASAVRRTINLTMVAPPENFILTKLNNDISLNKKIKVEIGYKNPFKEESQYEDIIWFPCGIFIISNASVSKNLQGWNISISGKDKMAFLDGSVGGTLPASVTFHEIYEYKENQDGKGGEKIIIRHPTIFQILQEAVHHWGQEDLNNIIIDDVPETAKLLVKYAGQNPIYFNSSYNAFEENPSSTYYLKYSKGDDIGYEETPFTYPGELILNAGETVVSLLNKISTLLGNFEFFYDVQGKFHFRQKQNYLNTKSPLDELKPKDYIATYSNKAYKYDLTNFKTITSLTQTPRYDNIKNDFVVWGEKETSSGGKKPIHYHLAIDKKPEDIPITSGIDLCSNCYKYIYKVTDTEKNDFIRYETSLTPKEENKNLELIEKPLTKFNWREEIYRLALINPNAEDYYYPYYAEMRAEWRNIFDPSKTEWGESHYNPGVKESPTNLDFWIDFIDSGDEINNYSVSAIGRRSLIITDTDIKTIYNAPIKDIIFLNNEDLKAGKKEKYDALNQKYFILTPLYQTKFQASSTKASAFEKIRELLYQHLIYNTQITIQCLPKYFLEPNDVIHLEDPSLGVCDNFEISQISLPLNYSGQMSITATQTLIKV